MPHFEEGNTEASKRGKNKRTLYLNALAKELNLNNKDRAEEEFYRFCVKVALGNYSDDAKPDPQLLKECLKRLYPEPRTTLPTYDLSIPPDLTRLEKCQVISDRALGGELPADVHKLLLDGLADVARVEEVDVLSKEFKKIKEHLGIE